MIVDSSALIAIIFREPGYEALVEALSDTQSAGIGAPTLVECSVVLSSRLGENAGDLLIRFLAEAGISVLPFTEAHVETALDAWLKYGKGRHSAALNFGDCLAYAIARLSKLPLLCVGEDFPQTDLPLVALRDTG